MKTLVAVHVVQFSLWDYETFQISPGGTGFIGPNGAGKTSLVDAVQIAMVGGHGQHLHFNAQSVHKDSRSIRAYALGTMRSGEGEQGVVSRKRDAALSYISLVFRGQEPGDVLSAGICIHATTVDQRVMGLYVLPGVELKLEHHLEDLGDRGKAPIDWELFAEFGRSHVRSAGRTPTITTRPETYMQELLHNVQQGVDVRKFLRAFGHSINLKAVSSVGDFLRGYLVEATPIDKRGTLQHIKTLRSLGRQIEDVTAQVARLEAIEKRYAKLAGLHRQTAVARAVGLQVRLEAADETSAALDAEITDIKKLLDRAQLDLPLLEQRHQTLNETYESLLAQLGSDPEAQQPAQLEQLRKAHSTTVKQARKEVERLVLQLREAMQDTVAALESRHKLKANAVEEELKRWDGWAKAGHIATPEQLQTALGILRACETQLSAERALARKEEDVAKASAQSAKAKLQAVNQGKKISDGDVATAAALFEQAGIAYEPVASLVQVTDPRWRGPIETFLGPHRLALVVEAGREDDAVDLIRRQRVNNVTVVQPEHLRVDIERAPAPDSVAALLDSTNAVALAYLRRILGRMKRVDSTEQLRHESRAMTVDYMLSANGGTKRIRPLDEQSWMLGVKLTNEDRVAAVNESRSAANAERDASLYLGQVEGAFVKVQAVLTQVTQLSYAAAVAQHTSAVRELDATADPAAMPVSERLSALREKVKEAREQSVEAGNVLGNHKIDIKGKETKLSGLVPQFAQAREELAKLEKKHADAIRDPDCDHDTMPQEYDRLQAAILSAGLEVALVELEQHARQLDSNIQTALAIARDGFVDFINEYSIGLVDERSDWRKAHGWIGRHIRKLNDSTLKEYRKQAEDAREAAEQSFRSDVKFKMREAIQRVRQEIRDLNAILQTCPAFTNGEKYQFLAKPSPAHRDLYELIVAAPDAGGEDLFGQQGVQNNLMALLEDSESGKDRGNNPLEDYRLLFNFDLQIIQDGKVVDLLSKRMGVASNGEHRVPFYVIAGAALATAYRIRPGVSHVGAGLMILDEAFYGMDAQNTYVTATFLKSLGLQLMMAGPDSDVGKLAPLMDNYYDLARYGSDVFAEHVVVKEAAHALFSSDIPILHPELIEVAESQLLAAARGG
jgi:chromosome segregation protein